MIPNLALDQNPLYKLAKEVSETGPDDVAFDGLRVLQHPKRFRQFLTGNGLDIVPVTVQLWPSLSCDVRCPTCPYRLTDARDVADNDTALHIMPLPLFKRTIHSLKAAGVESVFLTGGGEPLLHPYIGDMVDELADIDLGWGLFTNGTSLTESVAERLFAANPGFFRVSLDAGDPGLYKKIYSAGEDTFNLVKANIVGAGKLARKVGYNWFGVGFAISPNISSEELSAIRETFHQLIDLTDGGVNFASFRPRVIHHHNDQVVVPQRWSGQYHDLAQKIQNEIVEPTKGKYGKLVRIDHKIGAFVDCDRLVAPVGGWGGSWITVLDHQGCGSIISHLTGSSKNPTAWGFALEGGDFSNAWGSELRRNAQRTVIEGKVSLPVANGFRAIDAFLEKVLNLFPNPLDPAITERLMENIENWDIYRSTRPIFVG